MLSKRTYYGINKDDNDNEVEVEDQKMEQLDKDEGNSRGRELRMKIVSLNKNIHNSTIKDKKK